GHTSEQVSAVRAEGGLLAEYHHAVHARTQRFLRTVTEEEWSHVVDGAWDPPVTLLVRMASVAGEVAQHVGQAAYVRGLAERR
ncbi:MAG: DinB family protein, partial [Nocardioides sp.]|nr:DinB family protein [Nocardioides sp.]